VAFAVAEVAADMSPLEVQSSEQVSSERPEDEVTVRSHCSDDSKEWDERASQCGRK
jgi:hypothetical protein